MEKNRLVQNGNKVIVGSYPVVGNENFSRNLSVPAFGGLKKSGSAEIVKESQQAKKQQT